MKVGFTGTRKGMTMRQQRTVERALHFLGVTELHHGDCWGADEEADWLARTNNIKRVIHPPKDPKNRAFCDAEVVLDEKDYLERNHDIVDAGRILIAAPGSLHEITRSGTWATIRYAERKGVPVILVRP